MSAVQDTLSRADALLRRKVEREEAALEVEAVEQARADSFKRTEFASRYDPAFQAFGERVPMPSADERPGQYRARLYETLRRKLPTDNEWATTRADDVPPSARNQIEALVIEAAKAEGLRPSVANLPPDREVQRVRIDENTGARATEFFAKESFIRGMGMPGRRVVRIFHPPTKQVLFGPPISRYE